MSHDLKSKGLAIEALRWKLYINLFKMPKKTLILLIKVKESLVINTLVFWCGHTLNNISSDPEI